MPVSKVKYVKRSQDKIMSEVTFRMSEIKRSQTIMKRKVFEPNLMGGNAKAKGRMKEIDVRFY